MEFLMPLPNSKNRRRPIMSTKPNANLKAVGLTQAELDSVTGGNPAAVVAAIADKIAKSRRAAAEILKSGV
jgi:hypothetical protein